MKKRILMIGCLCYALGLGMVPVFGQVGAVKAKVPFDFSIPGKTLPRGEYTMTIRPHQLRIADGYGKMLAVVLANDAAGRLQGQPGKIVFRCYQDRCFLAEVWAPADEHGVEFHLAPVETQLRREQPGVYLALVGEKP